MGVSKPGKGMRFFPTPRRPHRLNGCRAHPASFSLEKWGSPGVKRPGHEAESSYPSNTEVKNDWIYALSASINTFVACIDKIFFFYCALFTGALVYCWHRHARFTEFRLWKESALPNLQVYNPVGYICHWEAVTKWNVKSVFTTCVVVVKLKPERLLRCC